MRLMDHDRILFVTKTGKLFVLRGFEIPEASRNALGSPLVDLLPGRDSGDTVQAILPASPEAFDADEQSSLVLVTRGGTIKRTGLSQFENVKASGVRAIGLKEGDEVVEACLCGPEERGEVAFVVASDGLAAVYPINSVREMSSRTGQGVRGIDVSRHRGRDDATVVGALVVQSPALVESLDAEATEADDTDDEGEDAGLSLASMGGPWVLFVTRQGHAKRTPLGVFRAKGRNQKGVVTLPRKLIDSGADGIAAVAIIRDFQSDVLVSTRNGVINRISAKDISVQSRGARGTKLMKIDAQDSVVAVTVVPFGDDPTGSGSSDE